MTRELISKRFEELATEMQTIRVLQGSNRGMATLDNQKWNQWTTSALHLVQACFGLESVHYQKLSHAVKGAGSVQYMLDSSKGVFLAAKEDFDRGYVFNLAQGIAGEVFAEFNEGAKKALEEGYKDVAAVLACAALEDTLKRVGRLNRLEVDQKEMAEVINALKTAGIISGGEKKIFESLPSIRNDALHARWDKVSDVQVRTVISVVESLLLKHF